MASLNRTGKLYLLKSVKENSSAVQSKYLKGASATFLFTNADFADEGNYSCWQNSSSSFHSQENLPIEVQIKDPLPTPFISVSSHTGDITHGQSFHINCSIEITYSFGTFKLLQTAGNVTTRPLSKETLNQSVTFSFLRTDFLNEGNYTCVYETTISGRNISSPESRSTSVTVTDLRLADGGHCAGRVEVFYKGTWGTVCDNAWELKNADVVCQQKGCGAAVSAPHNAAFGLGSGDILQDDVRCFGNETALSQCPFRGWRLHNCDHSKDASVICQDFIQKPQISLTSVYNYFMPGEVFHIVCSVDFPLYTRVDFYLYHNEEESGRETAAIHKTKVNFTRSRAVSNFEGNYSCRFQVQGTHLRFDSPFSDSIYINIVDLKKPNISIGHQVSKHIKGQSLDVICSTISKYPGGKFHLLKLTKFNFTSLQSVVSFNHSAVFSLPKTAIFHEGNYSCQYEVEVSGRSFVSPLSDPVNITGREHLLPKLDLKYDHHCTSSSEN
ncbi:uncharacterized protein LOC120543322 [Polypterus senegalus]|uniref:uncharacterized protein LOC120543322 n=1 Tax=Polypterus senegalus TaxID=55291 RepID=UPI0019669D87|nr:uncharacterized protein LOC120543322 [Polypterus senegalus]